jgi:asparagine synthase (glutamine-hydrolysing)
MCGITGIFDLTKTSAPLMAVEAMVRHIGHRGPDDQDVISCGSNGEVVLGHTRLAILDLSTSGRQPMRSASTDTYLTYNGECYNYLELRQELGGAAQEWHSETDTEVVLRAYERWGIDAFGKLRGMFALALWDASRRALVLARDPLGIKPIYYYRTDKLFIFASELGALLESGLVPRRICRAGLVSYLQTGSVTSPDTIIEGIRLLSPGHCMVVEQDGNGALRSEDISYIEDLYDRSSAPRMTDRREAVEALRGVLKESVRLHLASDVPLGLFLSGGMDSSALVALMSQVTDERPKTFSVIFAEKRFSEATYASQIAKKFDTEHHEIHLGEEQLFDLLPAALGAQDQPTMDGVNTFVVSKAVKKAGITVALSGLGGDELFAGYPTFRRALRLQSVAHFPNSLKQGVTALGRRVWNRSVQQKKLWQLLAGNGSASAVYAVSRQLFSYGEIGSLLCDSSKPASETGVNLTDPCECALGEDLVNAVSLCELRGYMTNTLLRDTDCMSMAHSLEVRVPLVDVEVVRFVLGLPGEWKVDGNRQKPLLQDALGDLLPPEVMNRPKMGFTLPFEEWMQSRLRDQIETAFADGASFESIGLEAGAVREVWQNFLRAPQRIGWSRPWALYVLGHWCAQHRVTL